jgi:hypothetical protein
LSLVDKYPLVVLRTLNENEGRALAIKFKELLRASLLVYPMTPEFKQEAKLVQKRITKSYYSLARVFSSTFKYYTSDLHKRDLGIPDQVVAKIPLLLIPLYQRY